MLLLFYDNPFLFYKFCKKSIASIPVWGIEPQTSMLPVQTAQKYAICTGKKRSNSPGLLVYLSLNHYWPYTWYLSNS